MKMCLHWLQSSALAAAFICMIAASGSTIPDTSADKAALQKNTSVRIDAFARSSGNDRPTAQLIGLKIFSSIEPAQVLKVTVDQVAGHRVATVVISGVKFHGPLNTQGFLDEVTRIAADAFAAAPIEELDLVAEVPLDAKHGIAVTGDLALPTARDVFTLTVKRSESVAALRHRLNTGDGVYWDMTFLQSLGIHCLLQYVADVSSMTLLSQNLLSS